MTQDQISLFQAAVAELKTVSIGGSESHHFGGGLHDILRKDHIQSASIDLANLSATGFTPAGMNAVSDLAQTFRPSLSANSRSASNATLVKFIAGEIIATWKGRAASTLMLADFDQLRTAVENWFASQTQIRQHVVACTLFLHRIDSFSLGPVTFYDLRDFPSQNFGIARDKFWPTPPPRWRQWIGNVWAAACGTSVDVTKPGGVQFERFIELATQRNASWVALIDVPGRAPVESVSAADVAVDVALAAIQLVLPSEDMRRVSRASGRAAPVMRDNIFKTSGAGITVDSSYDFPALAKSPEVIVRALAAARPLLDSMGRRLSGYIAATSVLPDLDEAWCNAAYWYHEALAENLDTVAVAKLETAIEVLFRAESMSGSKKRILDSFAAFFGLRPDQFVNSKNTVTVEQLTIGITTARSRVLHGTWPTLHTDLPSAKGKLTVTYRDVEFVARMLLTLFSQHMDEYLAAGETEDSTEALISWIAAQRRARAVQPTP